VRDRPVPATEDGMRGTWALIILAVAATLGQPALAAEAPSPPIRVIIEVPNDEQGRSYVSDRLTPALTQAAKPAQPDASASSPPTAGAPPAQTGEGEMSSVVASRLEMLRARARAIAQAAPGVPQEIVDRFMAFQQMRSPAEVLWLLLAAATFVGGGFAAQRLALWSAKGLLNFMFIAPHETVRQRLRLHAVRVSVGLYLLLAFLLGSLGAFLLFPWPPIFREGVLVILAAALLVRLSVMLGRVIIAPGARYLHFRILPLETSLAWFWYRWLVNMTVLIATGWALSNLLRVIGVSQISRDVVDAAWLGVVALAGCVLVWHRLSRTDGPPLSRLVALLLTVAIGAAWIFHAMHLDAAFWTLVVAVTLPLIMSAVRDSVHNVAGLDHAVASEDTARVGWTVVIERSIRVVLVIAGAVLIARAWQVDLGEIAMGETTLTRAFRGGLRIIIVLLVADVIWRVIKTLIDVRVAPLPSHGEEHVYDDSPQARRRQRLNTLLPILRNFLMVILLVVSILMILDSLGIQIGPLLAGAGVVGIAVGFGAQTLVKDIISGIFYLLDDAFRVGEYIQTSSHKGTVESFSLRSVKLRHHRGPLTTVPFGELGAVQNQSRDWVIDKMTIGVTYDTDLEQVRKLIKQVGRELAADPEIAPHLIEPLKMQGVEQMGDYSIQLRLKVMTKPGEQFGLRRKAYALIKRAFEENGIKFATPTVTVAGGSPQSAAVAARTEFEQTRLPPEGAPA
jgi:small-conductance mechanosensitive channel